MNKPSKFKLGNHDVSRAASRLGSENVNIANVLNLLLGGTSLVYYGEEIGMQDLPVDQLSFEKSKDEFGKKYGPNDYAKYSRDFSRTPMQWTSATGNSGFSQHTEPWLPVNKDSSSRNVQVCQIVSLMEVDISTILAIEQSLLLQKYFTQP